jgi:two-component system nitrogen regulation sensor histidine kinase GlnL
MILGRLLTNSTDMKGPTPDYKQLLDSLTTAILLVDDSLRMIYLNIASEHLLEVSQDYAQGMSLFEVFDSDPPELENINISLETSSAFTIRKATWHLHNGKTITVDFTVTPITESGLMMLEIQSLDRFLQISREEALITSQNTTRNLVRGLAHEVKNPLGGIRGAAQLLEKELKQAGIDSDFQEYTHVIISESDRLRNLVDRMLGPRQPTDFKAVNIHVVLERVITLLKAETKGRIHIRRNYDPSIPEIKGDLELLIQALLNVARNSMQALSQLKESQNPTIEIETKIRRQFTIGREYYPLICSININDNGPGIPKKIQEEIFYPMISGRAEGTGLGLSISQQLINQHKGLIEFTSKPGDTRFSIYIPLG